MRQTFLRLAATGTVAAGLVFAQAPAQTAPEGQTNSQTNQSQPNQSQSTRPKTGAERRENAHERLMNALNLTPAQREQARTIFREEQQSIKPVREQLKENRAAMAAAVKADNKAEIQRLANQGGQLMGKVIASRSEAMAKFYRTLTPAQRAKAEQMHQRFHERMQQRNTEHTNG